MSSKIGPSDVPKYAPYETSDDVNTNIAQQQEYQPSLSASLIEILHSDKLPDCAAFKIKESNTRVPMLACAMEMIFYAIIMVYVTDTGVPLFYLSMTYLRIIVPCIGWAYFYLLKKHVYSNVLGSAGKRVIQLGNVVILMQSLCSSLTLLAFALTRDDCHSDKCLQDFPKQMIPLGMVFHQFLGGIVMPMLYTCHDVSVSLFSVFIYFSSMLAAAVILHLPLDEIIYISLMGIVTFFCLASYEINIYSGFTSICKFETTLLAKVDSENKEYLMKIQTEEMRHMIGK
jgi:hypothetical protein